MSLEIFEVDGAPVAYFITNEWQPNKTEFLTPANLNLQMGMIVYGKDQAIIPHSHLPFERKIFGTNECIIVRKGKCLLDLYDKRKKLAVTKELNEGDIVLLIGGSHGFRMNEDTVLFEVKQGPYAGEEDKERFY